MLGGDLDRAFSGFDRAALRIGEGRPAFDDPHLGAGEQRRDAADEAVDDAVLPPDHPGEIEVRRLAERDAERVAAHRLGNAGETVGGVDQCLRWDAAADQTGAAEPALFDQDGVEAELAGADRGDIAARAAADHQHARAQDFGHLLSPRDQSTNSRAGCSRSRLTRWMNAAASQPSTMRWSKEEDRFIILRITTCPSRTTGRSAMRLTPTIATSG